jgi:hypothetical protein
VTSLWPVCDQSVTSLWPVCDQSVTSLWPVCDQFVTSLWPVCDQSVTSLSQACDQSVICDQSVTSLWPVSATSLSNQSQRPVVSNLWPVCDHSVVCGQFVTSLWPDDPDWCIWKILLSKKKVGKGHSGKQKFRPENFKSISSSSAVLLNNRLQNTRKFTNMCQNCFFREMLRSFTVWLNKLFIFGRDFGRFFLKPSLNNRGLVHSQCVQFHCRTVM